MTPPESRSPLLAFLLASLCSGCAALLNQILWTRILSLVFGSTVEAVAAVTAVFMAGLALGSGLAPRLVSRRTPAEATLLYSRIELGIGAAALVLAVALPLLEPLRASVGAAPVWFLAVVLLLVPAGLMGTTLVVQSHVVSASGDASRGARTGGLLFAANTFGAVAGAYGSVLFLVPRLGVFRTIGVATALNVTAALLARWRRDAGIARKDSGMTAEVEEESRKGRKRKASETAIEPPAAATVALAPGSRSSVAFVLFALFVAGFAGLVNEVAWTRGFILVAGPTIHAFAFVLGAIVLGLATGALLSSGVLSLLKDPRIAFALVQAGVAAASAIVIRSLASMPLLYGAEVRRLVDQPEALINLQAERALVLLFPAAALSGALFPLGLRLLRARFTASQAMGFGSALNTLGAILGASLAGFILLPDLGLDLTLRLAASASALAAIAVAVPGGLATRTLGLLCGTASLAFVFSSPALDKELFAGGAYKYSVYDMNLSVEDVLRRGELVSYAEGRVANVSVKRVASSFSLAVDGKVDATSGGDMLTQRLLAHVPFLVSERPATALVIGLGSGVTASAALTHDPASVTAVEISREVVDAARRFFAEANRGVLENPKLKLVVGDARQHILATKDRYDVIISEPSNPWMAGVSALFTREFFEGVRQHLAPGGVFCQWGHLYNMGEADLGTLLATFQDVFPKGRVFVISEADILIVGRDGATDLNEARLARIPEPARLDLGASKLSPSMLSAIPTALLADLPWIRAARRHTDDAPVLDFSAPLSIHAQTATPNRRRLLPNDAPGDAALIRSRLALLQASGSEEWTYDLGEKALGAGLADSLIAEEFVKSAIRLHRPDAAEGVLNQALERGPTAAVFIARALLYWNTDRAASALESLEAASKLDPGASRAYLLAAEIQSAAGNLQPMRKLIGRALVLNPRDAEALGLAAEAELKDNRLEPAFRLAEGALGIDPLESRALEVRALSLAQLGRLAEARNAFLRLIAAAPEASASRSNFGVFELQRGNASAAARLFKDAVDLDPSNLDAYRGLRESALLLNRGDLIGFADRGLARLSR
ncbi:MAG: fused MFS/spermidine synthase [Vicinamibacteria bacterium]|nr:fused MFS/spermidine synthase [Vicinamibacteria bacterium]